MENKNGDANWLDKLTRELDERSEVKANSVMPGIRLRPHEHLVGVVTPHLKKLYFLFLHYKLLSREAQEASRFLLIHERGTKEDEVQCHENEARAIQEIFWNSCCYTFPVLNDKEHIGIREGWKIVWSDKPSLVEKDFRTTEKMKEFFMFLFDIEYRNKNGK